MSCPIRHGQTVHMEDDSEREFFVGAVYNMPDGDDMLYLYGYGEVHNVFRSEVRVPIPLPEVDDNPTWQGSG